ncbi:MAG: hypothetical protein IIV93_08190 [Clostridia bacterium]|nr:hypothetical protein [Clostridia bacterium]
MTEQRKKHTIDDFREKPRENDPAEDWTEADILSAAKRIIRKMGLKGQITDPEGEEHERS